MRSTRRRAAHRVALVTTLLTSAVVVPSSLEAQQEHAGHSRPAPSAADSLARSRAAAEGGRAETATPAMVVPMGSGTSWLPLSAPVHGAHVLHNVRT